MLRADDVICATSTTGTGTLTLAACPGPPGGLDFDKWLKANGYNFVSGNAVLVSYTITEYTDATFTTEKQREKGIGTLTLGASITAATLARTTVQSIVTGLNTSTPAPTFAAPTAITIGTAANTLVYVGASAADMLAISPYQATSQSTTGFLPMMASGTNTNGGMSVVNNQEFYAGFIWPYATLVKSAFMRVESTYTGQNNNLYGRIYAVGANGLPGKLLIDFGSFGTLNSAFGTAFAIIKALTAGSGFLLTPGEYYFAMFPSWTVGGTGTPQVTQWAAGPIVSNRMGMNGIQSTSVYWVNGSAAVAPDPATGSAGVGVLSSISSPTFSLGTS